MLKIFKPESIISLSAAAVGCALAIGVSEVAHGADSRLGTEATPEQIANKLNPRRQLKFSPRSVDVKPAGEATAGPGVDFEILFAFGSHELTSQAIKVLDNISQAMRSEMLKSYSFIIEGHTDAVGEPSDNLLLSQRRAQEARNYLVSSGQIDDSRLVTIGKGESELWDRANPNSAVNRRVRVITQIIGQ